MVNNNLVPPTNKNFNSYNQPSVNQRGLVAIRAQSRGGEGGGGGETIVDAPGSGGENQPVHGIYTRDMSVPESLGVIVRILDRKTKVPQPNNLAACRTFAVTPQIGQELINFGCPTQESCALPTCGAG